MKITVKYRKNESDPEFDEEVVAKEVSFEKDEKGKYDWKEKGENNGK